MAASDKIYPSQDLLDVLGSQGHKTAADIADAMGVSERTAYRWLEEGLKLTERQADRLAVQTGHHPAELWPDWYLTAK